MIKNNQFVNMEKIYTQFLLIHISYDLRKTKSTKKMYAYVN